MNEQEEIQRRMAYHKALMDSGRSFIDLRLINMQAVRIYAVESLEPIYGIGEHGLMTVTLKESSRELEFEPNESKTEMVAKVLDTPKNRNFLASHTSYNFWEIVDQGIRREIFDLADEMTRKAVINKKAITQQPKKMLSDHEIDIEIARLQKIKIDRSLANEPIPQLTIQEEETEEVTTEEIVSEKQEKPKKRILTRYNKPVRRNEKVEPEKVEDTEKKEVVIET